VWRLVSLHGRRGSSVTNNSLAANRRLHISLIDRRHRRARSLAYRATVVLTNAATMARQWYAVLTDAAISFEIGGGITASPLPHQCTNGSRIWRFGRESRRMPAHPPGTRRRRESHFASSYTGHRGCTQQATPSFAWRYNVEMTGARGKVRPKGADALERPCRLIC
jgi:hypothetical protein